MTSKGSFLRSSSSVGSWSWTKLSLFTSAFINTLLSAVQSVFCADPQFFTCTNLLTFEHKFATLTGKKLVFFARPRTVLWQLTTFLTTHFFYVKSFINRPLFILKKLGGDLLDQCIFMLFKSCSSFQNPCGGNSFDWKY